ncbi:MAG: UDP-3-O-acyl-N-acetylglucosamine deacetylase, partial [Pseudomonadota bacterium]|nr:UDP-3-O-acyl-N-acetylglucosamine deacetylase [Pseudomonadota bacterium]
MLAQRTIRNKVTASGVGLHSGKKVNLVLHPADPDTGVVFRRTDGDKVVEIPALLNFVGNTTLSTTLENDGYEISTIEHLLSALAGTGVDNCIIECDGPEIPIMDGSSTQFV